MSDQDPQPPQQSAPVNPDLNTTRRNFMRAGALGAGAAAMGFPNIANAQSGNEPKSDWPGPKTESNPYGGKPGGGISLPDYYRPWPSIKNNNFYMPGTETLPKNEMRISFLGSTPWPPTRLQSGTSILVELGTGEAQPRRFFFDLGNGSIRNAIAMQVPAPLINDIFLTHLHADHYADLPYMYPFRAFSGGFDPLRVYGPSGRTPELGTKHMVKHMREMNRWHEENFNACPIGDGFEIDVHEFDWKQRNGIVYDKDGVKVRSWPRSHVKDGAVAYRLDWEDAGLSFVFTGDGRPDELSAEFGKGADVFVSEGTIDAPTLSAMKLGAPSELWEYTIDIFHTMYYAAGYLFKKTQPRMAAICHYEWSGDALTAESVAEVRANWDGLFMLGGPDVQVINVNKDYIWSREAALSDGAAPVAMDPRWLLKPGEPLPETMSLPTPKMPREMQQSQFLRDLEIDPKLYYPQDVYRKPVQKWPGVTLNPREMLEARGVKLDDSKPS